MAFARVVVDVGPAHLDRLFDYLVPDGAVVDVGSRVRVTFNGRARLGWVAALADRPTTDPDRVRPLDAVDGTVRWFDATDLQVWRWLADRFAGTLSGVIRHALPPRVVRVEREAAAWGPPGGVPGFSETVPRKTRAPEGSHPPLHVPLDGRAHHLRAPLHPPAGEGPALVDAVQRCVAAGRQALVVVPDPAPGPADDVLAAIGPTAVDLRGAQRDADRYRAFLRARRGEVDVVVGERGAALLPLRDLGLVVVIDEANPAYKERRNPRHHVREAALARGRLQGATTVLTSSLLSAHARRHAVGGHLHLLRADRATERAAAPLVHLTDRTTLAPSARRTRLTAPVATAISRTVADGGLVILLAAARGSGTSLACAGCRTRLECRTCGGGLNPAKEATGRPPERVCAACGWHGPPTPCPDCGASETFPLRAGAARFAAELRRSHPDAQVVHMEGFDQPGPDRRPAIAVMTRGSVVARPAWLHGGLADLLVIADPDVLLGRPDVEAAEDALRLWLDAARLARTVALQTAQPDHPAVQALVRADPDGFWDGEHRRRALLGFPPAGSLVRLTNLDEDAAAQVRATVPGTLLGPDPDGAALLKTGDLRGTLSALVPLRQRWALDDRRIRVEVDPVTAG